MSSQTALSLKLWVVMNRAVRSLHEPLRHQVEAHGLSFTEFAVLEVLFHKGRLPIGEIGNRILLTSGSMTYVVDKLQQRGLLQRRACEDDRRVTHAELTDDGRALMEVVFPEHAALIDDLMSGLDPGEQQAAVDVMKRLGFHAVAHGPSVGAT